MSVPDMMDELTLATCTKMKAAGIEIFAVGYGVTEGSREETLLKNCSGGDIGYQYYFGVDDTSIEPALTSILYQLIDLRLTT